MPQLFDDAFSYHMVGQTAEGLGTHDVRCAAVDQLQHFSCQEPSLTGLVTQGNDVFCHGSGVLDPCRRREVTALLKLFAGRVPHLFQEPDA